MTYQRCSPLTPTVRAFVHVLHTDGHCPSVTLQEVLALKELYRSLSSALHQV